MKVNQLKKEICPFCDSEMKIEKVNQTSKIDIVLYYKCECGWKDTGTLDIRKVDFENLIGGLDNE